MTNSSGEAASSPSLLPSRRAFLGAVGAGAALMSAPTLAGMAPASAKRTDAGGFLLPHDLTYLNNGSLGPSPVSAINAVARASRTVQADPVGQAWGPLLDEAERARAGAASLLGCDVEELAVTRNTTEGMNLVAQGLDLREGDRVLTTDHEHAGGSRCWRYLERHRGVGVDRVHLPVGDVDADRIVRLFEEAWTPRTKVVSVSHVTFTTGTRLPIAPIAALAEGRGALVVVDGAQGPGALRVNVRELRCDAYATSAHKWLLAPMGTGLLYIRASARERIRPMMLADGMGVYSAAGGTRDLPSIVGLGAAIEFLRRQGLDQVEQHARNLRQRVYESCGRIQGVQVVSPRSWPMASPIVTLRVPPHVKAHDLVQRLCRNHHVVVKLMNHGDLEGIRISTHIYNDEDDVDRLVAALEQDLNPHGS